MNISVSKISDVIHFSVYKVDVLHYVFFPKGRKKEKYSLARPDVARFMRFRLCSSEIYRRKTARSFGYTKFWRILLTAGRSHHVFRYVTRESIAGHAEHRQAIEKY